MRCRMALAAVSVVGLVAAGCGDDSGTEAQPSLVVEFEEPTDDREVVHTVSINGFEDVQQVNGLDDSLFVEETVTWDGITTVVVDFTDAEQPCRGAAFDGQGSELSVNFTMGEVFTIPLDGEAAVITLVGCKRTTVTGT